jgi:NosR/NirI family nitrous oxide reductase transcriptional regulator
MPCNLKLPARPFWPLLFVLALSCLRRACMAFAYEAKLPANLATAKDMCALLPCAEVFPGATHFSERKGQPPYVEAYDQHASDALLGYVLLSTDITDTPAYSGKPVVTLIGMDTAKAASSA